ncbi:glycoside hydrolase family 47 protein [Guyanagaster necrorhizus]|uniref:alpha-1,2-Mannosidase n=1 Tax=Guyanagaster necrorhizus TaxID=856835 RepID=A0A9P7VY23_9AGAR|nr:glycoside hydrolase family 47 protein [Guyanagaster necrorhizus MCA 3950]KAG7448703.1 glycoside hydrolase family 47 protein [Guyanagaster necrorhizus MCA 3950]
MISHWLPKWLIPVLVCTAAIAGPVQKAGLTLPEDACTHRDAVQEIFEESYAAYKKYAFGHDDLSPVSESFSDGLGGWGASIVDAMDTMKIMGLDDLFSEAVDFVGTIDFNSTKTGDTVSVFETTIRYVGGLLSAYELNGKKDAVLVAKAKQVADKLSFGWLLENQIIPYGYINFTDNSPVIATSNIAEAGTLDLEWSRLSEYTGNNTYAQLTEGAVRHIANLPAPLPGLAAQGIDPTAGDFVGGYITWGGGSDSYFEYLIKYARLSNTDDPLFVDTWFTAVSSSIQYLLRTSTVGNHAYLADFDSSGTIRHVGSHLACFYGGNWLLGGKLLNNQTIVDIALQLVDACWNTYASTATGIGPETFAFISSDGNFTGGSAIDADQLSFYQEHGFYITGSDYIQRPEVLESNFYAWRATGDTKYLDRAASAINSFQTFLPATVAFAGINDVNNRNSTKIDDMESFWLAEVLKYLYLTFDDPNHISLDEYVFNTEAHPFEAPKAKDVYGNGGLKAATESEPFVLNEGPPLPQISPNAYLPVPLKSLINPE